MSPALQPRVHSSKFVHHLLDLFTFLDEVTDLLSDGIQAYFKGLDLWVI